MPDNYSLLNPDLDMLTKKVRSVFVVNYFLFSLIWVGSYPLLAQISPQKAAITLAKPSSFSTPDQVRLTFDGIVGERLKVNLENWELKAPDANPALVEMFFDRERKPSRKPLPWSGEFIGKYLCQSILSYRILKDPRQKELIRKLTERFLDSQGPDGYLGAFDQQHRLTGSNWDIWGHYWAIQALLLYQKDFSSPRALKAATHAADLLTDRFLDKDFHFTNDGSQGQMNYSVIHAFTQLYILTGKPSYLRMAQWIVKEWDLPGAGEYMSNALAGKDMYQFPGNRWESLHGFLGMYDMYRITGEKKFYDAFTHIWYSILKGDRHNTGGFTSGEAAKGNPYLPDPIETCCTVAWIDMSIAMLRLTGDARIADELELSTFNGLLGGQHPSGRWWTYNTPMDGVKEASAHTINFQCRAGSPELNCCSVNAPRGLALLSEWAVMTAPKGVVVNFYGPSSFELKTPSGKPLKIVQKTDYPKNGKVSLQLHSQTPEQFDILLRIPAWSSNTLINVNGKAMEGVQSGTYKLISGRWKTGDRIEITFDMTPHYWVGDQQTAGKTSVYYGPLLLAFDPVYNTMDPEQIPELEAGQLRLTPASTSRPLRPWVLFKVNSTSGNVIYLSDFATAGAYGNYYASWLPVKGISPIPFNRESAIWTNRSFRNP